MRLMGSCLFSPDIVYFMNNEEGSIINSQIRKHGCSGGHFIISDKTSANPAAAVLLYDVRVP